MSLAMKARQKVKRKAGKDKVFGCDLLEHLQVSGLEVPQVLRSCTEFVETNGVVDGIYRLCGIASNVQKLRQEFEMERAPDLNKDIYMQDVHCVSSLCKAYFRQLPNPLLTYQLYDKFADAVAIQLEQERLVKIKDVLKDLPLPHYRTLEYLMRHLVHMASFSSLTNMHARNLAIVWAPNLLRSKDIEASGFNGTAAFMEVRIQSIVVEFILTHVEQLFGDVPLAGSGLQGAGTASIPEDYFRSLSYNIPSILNQGDGPPQIRPYHTIIDISDHKRKGSIKAKKWKSIFNLGRSSNDSKRKTSKQDDKDERTEKIHLRPAKSMDSLSSVPYTTDVLDLERSSLVKKRSPKILIQTRRESFGSQSKQGNRFTALDSDELTLQVQRNHFKYEEEPLAKSEPTTPKPGRSSAIGNPQGRSPKTTQNRAEKCVGVHISGPFSVTLPFHITSNLSRLTRGMECPSLSYLPLNSSEKSFSQEEIPYEDTFDMMKGESAELDCDKGTATDLNKEPVLKVEEDPVSLEIQDKKDDPFSLEIQDKKDDPFSLEIQDKKDDSFSLEIQDEEDDPVSLEIQGKEEDPVSLAIQNKEYDPVSLGIQDKEDDPVSLEIQDKEDDLVSLGIQDKEDDPVSLEIQDKEDDPVSLEIQDKEDDPVSLAIQNKEYDPVSLEIQNKEYDPVSLAIQNKEYDPVSLEIQNKEYDPVSLAIQNKEYDPVSLEIQNKEYDPVSLEIQNKEYDPVSLEIQETRVKRYVTDSDEMSLDVQDTFSFLDNQDTNSEANVSDACLSEDHMCPDEHVLGYGTNCFPEESDLLEDELGSAYMTDIMQVKEFSVEPPPDDLSTEDEDQIYFIPTGCYDTEDAEEIYLSAYDDLSPLGQDLGTLEFLSIKDLDIAENPSEKGLEPESVWGETETHMNVGQIVIAKEVHNEGVRDTAGSIVLDKAEESGAKCEPAIPCEETKQDSAHVFEQGICTLSDNNPEELRHSLHADTRAPTPQNEHSPSDIQTALLTNDFQSIPSLEADCTDHLLKLKGQEQSIMQSRGNNSIPPEEPSNHTQDQECHVSGTCASQNGKLEMYRDGSVSMTLTSTFPKIQQVKSVPVVPPKPQFAKLPPALRSKIHVSSAFSVHKNTRHQADTVDTSSTSLEQKRSSWKNGGSMSFDTAVALAKERHMSQCPVRRMQTYCLGDTYETSDHKPHVPGLSRTHRPHSCVFSHDASNKGSTTASYQTQSVLSQDSRPHTNRMSLPRTGRQSITEEPSDSSQLQRRSLL
ncbi:rho GTPase-activating protein 30 [Pelodytes ibericus]